MTSGLVENLTTSDPDVARAKLGNVYCPHQLSVRRQAKDFLAHHASGGFPGLGVHLLDYGKSDVEVAPVPFEDFVLVSRPLRGHFTVTGGTERVTSEREAIVMDPRGNYRLRWEGGCRVVNMVFERRRFEAVAGELLGREGPQAFRFDLGTPVTKSAAAVWAATTSLLLREVVPSGVAIQSSLVRTQVLRMTAAALLEAYPGSFIAAEPARADWSGPASVRRAIAFIEASADQDIGISEIAAASRTSVRGLQRAFRTYQGTTPLSQLREVRLRRAHTELMESTRPHEVSIAEVAYRWGFSSPSRFAEEHRRTYGCLPSEVLRRL